MSSTGLDDAERLLKGMQKDATIDLAMVAIAEGREVARAALIAAEGFAAKDMDADALAYFDMSLEAAPSARAFVGRGFQRYYRGDERGALVDFDQALTLDPRLARANYGRALALEETKNFSDAVNAYARAAEDPELRGRALYRRACVHLEVGRAADGRRDLLAAAEAGSRDAAGRLVSLGVDSSDWSGPALLALAEYHGGEEEPDRQAEQAAFSAAIEKLEGTAKHDALMSLAFSQRLDDDFTGAVKTFRRAAALDPKGPALANVARALYFADKNRKAEVAAREALDAGAEPFEAHRTLGELYLEEEKYTKALAALDRALAVAPPHLVGATQLLRGRALVALDRNEDARRAFLAAEDAGESEAREERHEHFPPETAADFFDEGVLWMQQGNGGAAKKPLERAISLYRAQSRAPGDFAARQLAGVLTNLANVLRQEGQWQRAVDALVEACNGHPTGFEPRVMLGNVLLRARPAGDEKLDLGGTTLSGTASRRNAAIAVLDRAVALARRAPYAHYARGMALMAAGRGHEAAADFEVALGYSDPSKRQDAAFNLVKSLWKAGDFALARDKCRLLHTDEDVEESTEHNIAALVAGNAEYLGNVMTQRFERALDVVLAGSTAQGGRSESFPFRFYGVRPAEWREGANMGHVYRLRFAEPLGPTARAELAVAVAGPWSFIDDDGSEAVWAGPFLQLSLGERRPSRFDGFFDEVVSLMKRIHEVAPLAEVVALNARALSAGSAKVEAWERWSLAAAPRPAPHPFDDDGALFFSAFGNDEPWPEPEADETFDAARASARRRARSAAKATSGAAEPKSKSKSSPKASSKTKSPRA